MRRWGPVVLIAVALLGLLLWTQCIEQPSAGFAPSDPIDLWPLAEDHLGPPPKEGPWFRESVSSLDYETLTGSAKTMLDQAATDGDYAPIVEPSALSEIRSALESREPTKWTPVLAHFRGRLAAARADFSQEREDEGFQSLTLALVESAACVSTAKSIEQWEQSHLARLFVLEAVSACVTAERLANKDANRVLTLSTVAGTLSHRAGLGNALYHNYRDMVLPKIAEASGLERASSAAAFALYYKQNDFEERERLIAMLLRGHSRAFSPEQTAEAGAESVKALRNALNGPWHGARDVLDRVAATQSFWNEFDALLAMDQEQAIELVKKLAEKARLLENPVGLALLHHDRASWSGLVQSAYVADAKEAVFRAGLLSAIGQSISGTDPISGGALRIIGGSAVFESTGNDAYSFLKSLTRLPVKMGPSDKVLDGLSETREPIAASNH